jgi:hypothetical protein
MTGKNICYNRGMRILSISILFGLLFFAPPVSAQLTPNFMGEAVNIVLDPPFPGPNQTVTVSLDDYSIDSTGATISWLLDGVEVSQFRNERTFTLVSPGVGKSARIAVRLTFPNRPAVSSEVTVTPVFVDVIVEPQTFTPFFYEGRALPVHGSIVNLTALVHDAGGVVNPADYTYNWQLNGASVYGGPRTGNNRAQITVPFGKNSLIGLTITNARGVVVGRTLINLPQQEVEIRFYEVSTLYGLSQRAIGEQLTFIGNSSTIRAVPYYLDTRAGINSLFTEWNIGGTKMASESSDPFEINLRREGAGSTQIGFKVRNLSELLQGDQASFSVQF